MTKKQLITGGALAALAAATLSAPIYADHNSALRGAYNVHQHYGVQYVGGKIPTPKPVYTPTAPLRPLPPLRGSIAMTHLPPLPPAVGESGQHLTGPVYSVFLHPEDIPTRGAYNPNRQKKNIFSGLRGLFGGNRHHNSDAYQPHYSAAYHPQPHTRVLDPLSQNLSAANVHTNANFTNRMLDWQESTTGKTQNILVARRNGHLPKNSLTLGAGIKGGFMYQKTDVAGQFPLLSRFPFFSNGTDTEAGVFAINNAALAITGSFGDWTTFYLQPEYSETEYAGQDEFQLRKAFVVFGNLDRTPFYAAFGRKTIDFGNFDSYNPFVHSENQHYFWAVSDQPVLELGYYNIHNGLKASVSAFSGGRQLRTAFAGEQNNITNYAFNIEKEFLVGRHGGAITVGGGYLHDTIYRNNFTAHTFDSIMSGTPPANFIEYRNSAVSAFAEYTSPKFDLMAEYTTTLEPWAAAIPQDAAGNVNPAYLDGSGNITFDEKLSVLTVQARYKPLLGNGKRLAISAVGNWGNIGDDFQGVGLMGQPTTWEKNQQHAFGVEYPINDYLDIGAEYVYNKGFIPFVAPQLVSNDETVAHAINVGFKARF